MNRILWLSLLILSSLELGCSATRTGPRHVDERTRPESLSRDDVLFVADANVQRVTDREPNLVIVLRTTNLTDSTLTLASETDNCEPAFELESLSTGRRFVWSHAAWRRRHEPAGPPPISDVACIGTAIILTLAPRGNGELGRQEHPVGVVRGDSVPPGRYRTRIPAVLYEAEGAISRLDTIRVWSGSVTLP